MPFIKNKGSGVPTNQIEPELELSVAIERSNAAVAVLVRAIIEAGDLVRPR